MAVSLQFDSTGIYQGPLNALGQKHGLGVYLWFNGDIYIGLFKEDVVSGVGLLSTSDLFFLAQLDASLATDRVVLVELSKSMYQIHLREKVYSSHSGIPYSTEFIETINALNTEQSSQEFKILDL